MTTNTQSADLVRLSVFARELTTALVPPSRLPLAEIPPEVAHDGYTLVGTDGRALDAHSSLLARGVHDGVVLTLVTGADAPEQKVYDDIVKAVADSVEGTGAEWTEQSSRMTTPEISGLLLLLGAVTLFLQLDSGPVVSMVAGAASTLLLLAGAVFALVRSNDAAAVVVLVGAGLDAVVAGLSTSSGAVLGTPLLVGGLALASVGGVSVLPMPARSWAFLPLLVVGGAAEAVGGLLLATAVQSGQGGGR